MSHDEVERVWLAGLRLEPEVGEIAAQFALDKDDIKVRIGAVS